jgi:hypothetical protein
MHEENPWQQQALSTARDNAPKTVVKKKITGSYTMARKQRKERTGHLRRLMRRRIRTEPGDAYAERRPTGADRAPAVHAEKSKP